MNKITKYIFVTGGVLSGVGKGISAAALGNILSSKGYSVFTQKLDPYYNTDPGTMSPYQHGEVYVTEDGAETDLDLGHYERFIGNRLTQSSNWTQGRILYELLKEEREGKYEGKTVQMIPHITNKIIEKIEEAGNTSKADFVIVEIGGTVGDIESQPFIFAISRFINKNKDKSFLINTTYIPYLSASKEWKTKPTQHSLSGMMGYGLFPDMLLLRSNDPITDEGVIPKISRMMNMNVEQVVNVPNSSSVYDVPLTFDKQKLGEVIINHFNMENRTTNHTQWKKFASLVTDTNNQKIEIGMVGKYVELEDAYKSIIEAVTIAAAYNKIQVKFRWIQAEGITKSNVAKKLNGIDSLIILPGFGKRGFDGKVVTAEFARDKNMITLGICYGFQAMVVAHAKTKGILDATSSEVDEKGSFVIDIIKGKNDGDFGGTLRLGQSKTLHKEKTIIAKIYNSNHSFERHRHRYEANPRYITLIEDKDFIFSGFDEESGLAEVCEMPKMKFFIGLQAHPEFNSTPLNPSPLFDAFLKATKKNSSIK